jgi:hypothetical protein
VLNRDSAQNAPTDTQESSVVKYAIEAAVLCPDLPPEFSSEAIHEAFFTRSALGKTCRRELEIRVVREADGCSIFVTRFKYLRNSLESVGHCVYPKHLSGGGPGRAALS